MAQGIKAILEEYGYILTRYLTYDELCKIYGPVYIEWAKDNITVEEEIFMTRTLIQIYSEMATGKDNNKKVYYPRNYFGSRTKKLEMEQDKFYSFLKRIQAEALYKEYTWSTFYHYVDYFTEDGLVYRYTEDNDYLIPYSIEANPQTDEAKARFKEARMAGILKRQVDAK